MCVLHSSCVELPKSTQNLRLPFVFFTMTTGEAQGLLEGRMTPLDSICWTWAISSRRTAGFGGDMAGGAEVPRSRWCAEAAGYNPDRPPAD